MWNFFDLKRSKWYNFRGNYLLKLPDTSTSCYETQVLCFKASLLWNETPNKYKSLKETERNLNKHFTNIDPNVGSKIPNRQEGFEKYLANCNNVINDASLTDEEVRNAFYSLKTNESLGCNDISFNAIMVNKSEYIASSRQRHNMTLNKFFFHVLNHVLKIF